VEQRLAAGSPLVLGECILVWADQFWPETAVKCPCALLQAKRHRPLEAFSPLLCPGRYGC
jgi:hypothetical protein